MTSIDILIARAEGRLEALREAQAAIQEAAPGANGHAPAAEPASMADRIFEANSRGHAPPSGPRGPVAHPIDWPDIAETDSQGQPMEPAKEPIGRQPRGHDSCWAEQPDKEQRIAAEQARVEADRAAGKLGAPATPGQASGGHDRTHVRIPERRLQIARVIAGDGPQKTASLGKLLGCALSTVSAALKDCDWFEQDRVWLIHLTPVGLAAVRKADGVPDQD